MDDRGCGFDRGAVYRTDRPWLCGWAVDVLVLPLVAIFRYALPMRIEGKDGSTLNCVYRRKGFAEPQTLFPGTNCTRDIARVEALDVSKETKEEIILRIISFYGQQTQDESIKEKATHRSE